MIALTSLIAGLKQLAGMGQSGIAKPAWALLKAGRLDEAAAAALEALEDEDESGELRHVLFNVNFLRGDYEGALEEYRRILENYARLTALDEAVIHTYAHLGRYREAAELARKRKLRPAEIALLERLAATPFGAAAEGVVVLPFADHPLTPYLPAFTGAVNGQDVVAHVDTGGNYLLMGPARAKALGIEVKEAGKGHHGANAVPMSLGLAGSFQLGGATFRNVPVTVLATLTGQQDLIIFGTNLLMPFLATLDYPKGRLMLSVRADREAERAHLAMLSPNRREVQFYLWSDHYMIAQGALGERRGWFFVDSGLVMIHEWQGSAKQSAMTASKSQFAMLGVENSAMKSSPFALPGAIGLMGLPQQGHIVDIGHTCPKELGGVEIHGLISHAYLKQYAWTLDFERRSYIFSTAD